MTAKKHKELVKTLKKITKEHIKKNNIFYQTRIEIHNYSWGLSMGFYQSKYLTQKEFDNFNKWLIKKTFDKIKYKVNIGSWFKPKYINKIKWSVKSW